MLLAVALCVQLLDMFASTVAGSNKEIMTTGQNEQECLFMVQMILFANAMRAFFP